MLAKYDVTANSPNGLSIKTPIKDFIYSDWAQGPNVGQITFEELLNHTSGFAQLDQTKPGFPCAGGNGYSQLRTLVKDGLPDNPPPQPAGYGNCNFSLLRELLPALYYQSNNNPVSVKPDGDQRAEKSSELYISYMNMQVFAPFNFTSFCKSHGESEILAYPFPAFAPGLDLLTGDGDTYDCGPAGWSLTASDLFKVINDVARGNVLLTADQKSQMGPPNCLGWDCKRGDCPDPYVCKNGSQGDDVGREFWAYVGILKCVPVVVYVNSFLPWPYQPTDASGRPQVNGRGDIIDLVTDAFSASGTSGTPKACP